MTSVLPRGDREFLIVASEDSGTARTLVPPDVATCADCLREMRDPADRRTAGAVRVQFRKGNDRLQHEGSLKRRDQLGGGAMEILAP